MVLKVAWFDDERVRGLIKWCPQKPNRDYNVKTREVQRQSGVRISLSEKKMRFLWTEEMAPD